MRERDLLYSLAKQNNDPWILQRPMSSILTNEFVFNNDLQHFNRVYLESLFLEAFTYHNTLQITGPYVYFTPLANNGFEPIFHLIGSSTNPHNQQSIGYIQHVYPDFILSQFNSLLASHCVDPQTNKYQITRADIEKASVTLGLWQYLKLIG